MFGGLIAGVYSHGLNSDAAAAERAANNSWELVVVKASEEYEWLIPLVAVHDDYEDCEGELILEGLAAVEEDSWLSHEIDENGYEFLTGDQSVLEFCLGAGIAPGQRFYVSVSAYGATDYYGEYDEDWAGSFVWAEPLSKFGHERAWEEWLMVFGKSLQRHEDRRETFKARCAVETTWRVLIGTKNQLRYGQWGSDEIFAELISVAEDIPGYASNGLPRVSEHSILLKTSYDLFYNEIIKAGWGKYQLVVATHSETAVSMCDAACYGEGTTKQYQGMLVQVIEDQYPRRTSYLLPALDRINAEWQVIDGEDRLKPRAEDEE